MARFRFEVIAPLLGKEEDETLHDRLVRRAGEWFKLPDGRLKRYSWGTLEDWLYRYRNGGLEALTDAPRRDRGAFRVMQDDLMKAIGDILSEAPRLKSSNLLRELVYRGNWDGKHPSRSALYRYIKSVRPAFLATASPAEHERRDFEAHHANQLWQADIMYGPKIPRLQADGRKRREKTYLIAVIDDHSRLICHAEFSFSQNLAAWFTVLKKAVAKRGIPDKLYCDNGKVFRSDQIGRICATIGTRLCFTQIRDAAAKGKIERFFKRLRAQFLEVQQMLRKPDSLDELNLALAQWLETDYNRAAHQGINLNSPNTRWLKTSVHVRHLPGDDALQEAFRFLVKRKVGKTGAFRLYSKRYETSAALVGKKVDIHFDPSTQTMPEVSFEGQSFGRASLVDPAANLNRRRRKPNDHKENS